MDRTTLTAKEAAGYIGISYWLLLELTKKKEISFISVGNRKLFRKNSLDLWMVNKETESCADPITEEVKQRYGVIRKINS